MLEYEGQKVVAVIIDPATNKVYDHALTWETAQTLALDGYKVAAVADDGHMSAGEIQRLCDAELERHNDCFGTRV